MSGDGKELAPRGEAHPTTSTTGITLRKPEEKKIAPVRRVLPDELVPQVEGWIVLQGRNAYAANSLRALLSDWSHFARWAWESGQIPYITLAAPGDLIVYFDDHDHLAKATLNRRHASLVRLYRVLGHPDNPAEHEHLAAHLKAMRRDSRHGEGRGQAAALRWKEIERIIDALDPDNSLRDARARLALGLCYDGMLRRGEIARLKVADLHPIDEEHGSQLGDDNASITIRRSKTNQEGDPEALHCARLTARWAGDWIERIGLGPEDYLICQLDEEGNPSGRHDKPVPDSEIAAIFKEAARQAGFPAETVAKISGHSPRVGMTQDLVAEGMPLVDIMFVGRWKSPEMVFRYAKALGTRYHVTAELSGRQGRGQKVERPTPRKGGVIKPKKSDQD